MSSTNVLQVQSGKCLAKSAAGLQVGLAPCGSSGAAWDVVAVPMGSKSGHDGGAYVQLRSRTDTSVCLTSSGDVVPSNADPWCWANNNMWRSNTDVLQTWTRTMIEIESMANQGPISRPGAWSFPDCSELGVPGQGVFTWEETKVSWGSVMAGVDCGWFVRQVNTC